MVANIIIRSGSNGMFIDDRAFTPESIATGGPPGSGFKVFNNVIIHPGQDGSLPDPNGGIRLYGADLPNNWTWNNVVVGGSGESYAVSPLNKTMPLDEQATTWSVDGKNLKFKDMTGDDYRPAMKSPLIDTGTATSNMAPGTMPWTKKVHAAKRKIAVPLNFNHAAFSPRKTLGSRRHRARERLVRQS